MTTHNTLHLKDRMKTSYLVSSWDKLETQWAPTVPKTMSIRTLINRGQCQIREPEANTKIRKYRIGADIKRRKNIEALLPHGCPSESNLTLAWRRPDITHTRSLAKEDSRLDTYSDQIMKSSSDLLESHRDTNMNNASRESHNIKPNKIHFPFYSIHYPNCIHFMREWNNLNTSQ